MQALTVFIYEKDCALVSWFTENYESVFSQFKNN